MIYIILMMLCVLMMIRVQLCIAGGDIKVLGLHLCILNILSVYNVLYIISWWSVSSSVLLVVILKSWDYTSAVYTILFDDDCPSIIAGDDPGITQCCIMYCMYIWWWSSSVLLVVILKSCDYTSAVYNVLYIIWWWSVSSSVLLVVILKSWDYTSAVYNIMYVYLMMIHTFIAYFDNDKWYWCTLRCWINFNIVQLRSTSGHRGRTHCSGTRIYRCHRENWRW